MCFQRAKEATKCNTTLGKIKSGNIYQLVTQTKITQYDKICKPDTHFLVSVENIFNEYSVFKNLFDSRYKENKAQLFFKGSH